jgi:murein DD-endopeptidase MepM/ murein hydrolase activator NlpD
MHTSNIDELRQKYDKWLADTGPSTVEIVSQIQRSPVPYIKTGLVDMAGPNWSALDENLLFIGGYGEQRIIGATDHNLDACDMRTLHIGLDVFAKAGTEIRAPIKGKVHSFKDNNGSRDYGPTIILEHEIAHGMSFFTLYGHLSRASIRNIRNGEIIEAGTGFASLGGVSENGGWPPHLHFQIILDMLGKEGDFFGLCKPSEKEYWHKLCPDPLGLLGIEVAYYE